MLLPFWKGLHLKNKKRQKLALIACLNTKIGQPLEIQSALPVILTTLSCNHTTLLAIRIAIGKLDMDFLVTRTTFWEFTLANHTVKLANSNQQIRLLAKIIRSPSVTQKLEIPVKNKL